MKKKKPRIIKGVPLVVDGDTLWFEGHIPGKGRKVRLAGIDAPENEQVCRDSEGQLYDADAKAFGALEKLLLGQKEVRCEVERWMQDGWLTLTAWPLISA